MDESNLVKTTDEEQMSREEQIFTTLVRRFRDASDPVVVKQLGNLLGRMIFGAKGAGGR